MPDEVEQDDGKYSTILTKGYAVEEFLHKVLLTNETRGVSHFGLAIYILKKRILRQKRIMETQIFHHAKIYLIFKKNPLKETKILQDIIRTL